MNYITALAISGFISIFTILLYKKYSLALTPTVFKISIIFLLFFTSAWLIPSSLIEYEAYEKMQNWNITQASIIRSQVIGERAKLPEITYQYSVKEKLYDGKSNLTAPAFGNKKFRDQTARNILKEYEEGTKITIYYNPNNASQSKVIVKTPWYVYIKYSLGILFLTISLSLTGIFFINNKRRAENEVTGRTA